MKNVYYEIELKTGNVIASSSGSLSVDDKGLFNGRLIVYDERILIPMQHYIYDFDKKKIVKKSATQITAYENEREQKKNQREVDKQARDSAISNKMSIVNDGSKSDKQKLNALIYILKEKKIIGG